MSNSLPVNDSVWDLEVVLNDWLAYLLEPEVVDEPLRFIRDGTDTLH